MQNIIDYLRQGLPGWLYIPLETIGAYVLGRFFCWFFIKRIMPFLLKEVEETVRTLYFKKASFSTFVLLIALTIKTFINLINFDKYEEILDFLIVFNVIHLLVETLRVFLVDYYLLKVKRLKIPILLLDIVIIIIYALVLLTLLSTFFHVDIAPFIATSAVLSMIIGLALQDTLSNIFAGLAMQIDHPFGIGNWIKIGDMTGKIVEINWRTTKIITGNSELVSFPNNILSKTHVINYSPPEPQLASVQFIGISYSIPPDIVQQNIMEILDSNDEILKDPVPVIGIESYEDSSIKYFIRYFIKDFTGKKAIATMVFKQLWYKFNRTSIEIPFPIRNIYIKDNKEDIQNKEELKKHIKNMLKQVDFLDALQKKDLEFLANLSKLELYTKGEILFKQGEQGSDFYIINCGKVLVSIKKEDGEDIIIATLTKGDFFGELSLLTGEKRSATIYFDEYTELIVLTKEALSPILQKNPSLIEVISRIIAIREAEKKETLEHRRDEEKEETPEDKVKEHSHALFHRITHFFKLE